MAVAHVTDKDFQKVVLDSKIPVLVDFFAVWCGPCKQAAPILDKLSEEFAGKVLIVKLDVDENQESSQKYGVMSIPTIIAFKNGEKAGVKIGFGGEHGYRQLIESVLK